MDTVVSGWGNSFGLRIPKAFAKEIGLKSGSKVKLVMENDRLVITKVKKFSLKSLVNQISPDNRYDEVDLDKPVGREIW
jgi:antitoxin MazE